MESRRGAFIDINKDALKGRMQTYYDKQTAWETLEKLGTGLTRNAAGFDALKAREKTLKKRVLTVTRFYVILCDRLILNGVTTQRRARFGTVAAPSSGLNAGRVTAS